MVRQLFVGSRIARMRREKAMTQVDMAARLGISPSYLNLIEHNRRPLTRALLDSLEQELGIDRRSLSGDEESRLHAELAEVFADSFFADHGLGSGQLAELVSGHPEVCQALLALYRSHRKAREELEGLSERLLDNPFLSASSHQVLTLLTSIRSFSEILKDNADLAADRRQRFAGVLVEESERLTQQVNALFDFITGDGIKALQSADSPADQVLDFLHQHHNHFPELEAVAGRLAEEVEMGAGDGLGALERFLSQAHGIVVEMRPESELTHGRASLQEGEGRLEIAEGQPRASRRFHLARATARLFAGAKIEARMTEVPALGPGARTLLGHVLADYVAGAAIMPYEAFLEAAEAERYDLHRLMGRFEVSMAQVCHRLITLQRRGAEGVPFHFLRIDIAGNILKRFSNSGLRIPHYTGVCPRWNVHEAFPTSTWPARLAMWPAATVARPATSPWPSAVTAPTPAAWSTPRAWISRPTNESSRSASPAVSASAETAPNEPLRGSTGDFRQVKGVNLGAGPTERR
jgi:transcriptional regulator with XRE-family HTH domain